MRALFDAFSMLLLAGHERRRWRAPPERAPRPTRGAAWRQTYGFMMRATPSPSAGAMLRAMQGAQSSRRAAMGELAPCHAMRDDDFAA